MKVVSIYVAIFIISYNYIQLCNLFVSCKQSGKIPVCSLHLIDYIRWASNTWTFYEFLFNLRLKNPCSQDSGEYVIFHKATAKARPIVKVFEDTKIPNNDSYSWQQDPTAELT